MPTTKIFETFASSHFVACSGAGTIGALTYCLLPVSTQADISFKTSLL